MSCAALLVSIAICLATIVDMYFTARYFHGRLEVFGAMVLGSILFQMPMAHWLMYGQQCD